MIIFKNDEIGTNFCLLIKRYSVVSYRSPTDYRLPITILTLTLVLILTSISVFRMLYYLCTGRELLFYFIQLQTYESNYKREK
jgi:hypothetical protein